MQIAPAGLQDKETARQLKLYQKAREEGHQPWSTTINRNTGYTDAEVAMAIADRTGRPYKANDMVESVYPEKKELIKEWTPDDKAAIREAHQAQSAQAQS